MDRYFLLVLMVQVIFLNAKTQVRADSIIPQKKYVTQRSNAAITIDGIPNEDAWNAVEWAGDFTQTVPNEGTAPSLPTRFKMIYDDRYLYFAFDCKDSPDSVSRRMGRRDQFPGDLVEVNIDSYHDKRTGFSFSLSASGVRGDEFISNETNWDANWNPIWTGKTHLYEQGWTAEMKIPLSQLRYGNEKEKVWGLQVLRLLFRKQERSHWQFIPQSSGVWVSRFGELSGLNNIPLHRQVEIAPYVTTQVDTYKKQPGNPYAKGMDSKLSGGLDGKVAVTNDLILDFTVNPDFGQVEADPSQVRIDGFQNFFSERRPFFMESRNIFDYQLTGSQAGGNYDSDLLFYSRRIGSSPHGFPQTRPGEYVKRPQNTSILGAAKFSGKTKDGWSIGIMESITEKEMAEIDSSGKKRKELVEPLTSYFVGRLQKDIEHGNTIIGGIFTAVNRQPGLDHMLHKSAYSGGIDFRHYWKKRTWFIAGNMIYSNVNGSKEAILRTQTSFEHLFQRPDASEVTVNPERTSLTGTGATLKIGKTGGREGKWGQVFKFETGLTYRSPELELNDIGFMLTANEINHFTWVGLQSQRSFSKFRNGRINYNHWLRWDFAGKLLYAQFNTSSHVTFRNNLQMGTGFTWNPYDVSNNALRGGEALRKPPGVGANYNINTDYSKKIALGFNAFKWWGFDNTMKINSLGLSLTYVPANAFSVQLSANYEKNQRTQDQFVQNVSYGNNTRTIVGAVDQETIRFTTRMSYNITPDLTIQYYAQPFITRPLYSSYAWVSDPKALKMQDRFTPFTPAQLQFDNERYLVDENQDGIVDYSFGKPDFNFVQFRSNLVLRWEYRPGSELFFVWSDSNTADAYGDLTTPVFKSLVNNAFAGNPRNSFLVKFTYRFLR